MLGQRATSIPAPGALAALVAATALLAGCEGEPAAVTDRDAVLRIELSEYRLDPQVVRVAAGRIRIVGTNVGVLPHNLKVRSLDRERGEEIEILGEAEGTAFPRQRIRGELTLGPGKYELVCTIGNHDDLGQTGTLIVGDGSDPSAG